MPATRSGLGLAVLSAATFGTSGTFASSLLAAGWSTGAAVTVRVGVAALLLTGPALVTLGGRWALLRSGLPSILAFGLVAVAGCQLCYFNAVKHLSVGVALLLEYSGTVLVVGWMWLRHRQRPRRLTAAGTVLAIVGLMLVLNLTGHQRVDAAGVLWGLAAAAGLAVYFVVSGRADDPVPPIVTAWAGMTVGALALLGCAATGVLRFTASTADVDLAGARVSWLVPVAGLAVVAGALAYAAGIGAARRLGPRLASFVGLAEVLCAVLIAWLLLGQRPSLLQALGGVVVLAGIALVRADEQVPARTSSPDQVTGAVPVN
ncbi:DMT family transporter [uncultured Jatrophihabitans sp.]|uniref:EamA family transporter n=1 Tax=uncultured Jatrophihabitans sp. TaxID=1610747 RepID=UPI0035C9EF49